MNEISKEDMVESDVLCSYDGNDPQWIVKAVSNRWRRHMSNLTESRVRFNCG